MTKLAQNKLPGRQPSLLGDLVEGFLLDLESRGKSAATIRSYGHDLRTFAKEREQADIRTIIRRDLEAYLRGGEGLSPATHMRRRSALRSFFDWVVDQGHLGVSPAARLPGVPLPDRQPRTMPDADVWKVLKSIDDMRDKLAFYLMAETGARVSEVLSIRLERIRLHAQEVSVVGQGGRERTIYLIKTESLDLLKRYLRDQHWIDGDGETIIERGLLFRPTESKQRRGRTGQPIHYTVMQKAWQRYCEAAGVEATIHQLRHAYATRLVNEGKPIEVIQKILGHRDLTTTQRYAVVSDEMVRRALEGLSLDSRDRG